MAKVDKKTQPSQNPGRMAHRNANTDFTNSTNGPVEGAQPSTELIDTDTTCNALSIYKIHRHAARRHLFEIEFA